MAEMAAHSARSVLIVGVLCVLLITTSAATIGVDYGTTANNLPSPLQVVKLLQSLNVKKVKIYDTAPAVLQAFANTGIDVSITVQDADIPRMASDLSFTQKWVNNNIRPFPATTITLIAVGNEILTSDTSNQNNLVPAMKNLHSALVTAGLSRTIKVSTPHAFSVLETSYPPSAGAFQRAYAASVMRPLLDFLAQTGSVFMVNIFPYFSYTFNPNTINLDYALLKPNAPAVTDGSHRYTNLFDAQLDAIISAMVKLGHSNIPVVVTESGWPSLGDSSQIGPSLANAQTYNNNLVKHVLANPPVGTPLRPGVATPTYVFSLFNENLKTGKLTERNWGLFYPNMSPVYPFKTSSCDADVCVFPLQRKSQDWEIEREELGSLLP